MTPQAADAATIPGVRLTTQQRVALDRGVGSVALSAGAGCGKTTVLAERFLQELEGPDARPLRSVVALTFTEKAARELRQRIRLRCREKIESGTDEDVSHWRTILRGLEAAPIGTFHEFCGRMLRLHAVEAGIDPEFDVLDDSISRTLRDQAVRITLRSALSEQDLDLIDLAVDYGLGQTYETLGGLAASATLRGLETWVGQDAETILALWRDIWDREGRPALIRQAAHAIRRCRDVLIPLEAASAKLRARRDELLPLLDEVETGRCPDSRIVELNQLSRIVDLKGKDVWPSKEVKELLGKRFEALRGAIKKITPRLSWTEKLTGEEIASRQRLARLALKARHEYERLKHDRHGLDFDDLQLRFVELLRDRPEILKDPHECPDAGKAIFEFILVDEFQDTDRLQSEILRRLGGSEFLNGRLFVVGDFKQSIYGFRGAQPSIFREWRKAFPASGRRELGENFRSVPGIIHFVNALYAECFEGGDGGPMIEGGNRILNLLAPMRNAVTGGPAVEFLWADVGSGSTESGGSGKPRRSTVQVLRAAEAGCLARHIRERLDAGWTIFDREEKRMRLAGPGDVAFLLRAMTDVGPYESALAREGFDHHTVGGSAFFAQQEIHDVVNVLSIVEDPLDEVALAGALRSPFFSMSDDGLYWLATAFPGGGLTVGLQRAGEITDMPPSDRRQAIRARLILDSWRELKDRVPIATLLARILDESGYEAALVCEFLGPRKLANTRKLVTMARGFDRQGGFLLADFVAQLRAHRDDPPREEQASTSDEEGASIRLMSIHQAKGLEFPIVVVPDLNRSSEHRNQLVGIQPDLGLVVRPSLAEPGDDDTDPTDESEGGSLGWETFRAIGREHDEQESLRLFYVATTRARDALILSSGYSFDQEPRSSALRLLDERFDLRTGICRARLPDGWPDPEVAVAIREMPPEDGNTSGRPPSPNAPRKLSFDEIRETIVQGFSNPQIGTSLENPGHALIPSASLVDLDRLDGLSSRSRRIDRLIRGMVADPRLFRGSLLHPIAVRAAAKQIPAAHAALVREACRLLGPWVESDSFRPLRAAPPDSIRQGFTWSLARQVTGQSPTVFRGACDLLVRDQQDLWMPMVVCLGGEEAGELHRAVCMLRLLLSASAAGSQELGPVRAGWILELGHPAGAELRRLDACDPDAIDRAISALFSAIEARGD